MIFTDIVPELLSLFFVSFLAATLLPLGSELLLLGVVHQHPEFTWYAGCSATLGNTLGGMTNWWLGSYLLHFHDRRWFPISAPRLVQVQKIFQRYGQPILLLSWMPLVGDGLCLAAGVAKLHWFKSLIWIAVGKSMRYGALIWGTNALVLS